MCRRTPKSGLLVLLSRKHHECIDDSSLIDPVEVVGEDHLTAMYLLGTYLQTKAAVFGVLSPAALRTYLSMRRVYQAPATPCHCPRATTATLGVGYGEIVRCCDPKQHVARFWPAV